MDKFTDMMLGETGLIGMIGKSERGPKTIESIKQHQAVYLMAVGGAAYLVSKAIKKARVVAFADSGDGGHLRVRGGRHAGVRGGRREGRVGTQHRPENLAGQDRQDPGRRLINAHPGGLHDRGS
jgi:hypothetical protein